MQVYIWLVLLIVFIVAEAATVSMVSTWFAIGSLAAAVTALLGGPLWLQVMIFLGVSAITLAMLRPIAKEYLNARITPTNVDAMAGKLCLCITDIDNVAGAGQVKVGDVEWSARSTDGAPICAGTQVKIDRVEGVKVYVTPVSVAVK